MRSPVLEVVRTVSRRAARSLVAFPHVRMLCAGARVALALVAATSASASFAQEFPRLKAGLWEMERSADRGTSQSNRMTICLDDTVQKQMFDMGSGAMAFRA